MEKNILNKKTCGWKNLSSKEKDSDRKEAIRIMECIKDKVKYNE